MGTEKNPMLKTKFAGNPEIYMKIIQIMNGKYTKDEIYIIKFGHFYLGKRLSL
jgi:hypothetical protein